MARANRKQLCDSKKINASSSSASKKPSKKTNSGRNKGGDQDDHIIYTRDNVKLSMLLRKLLTSTDVGNLGRILLPKREAEENLPDLASKEGMVIVMKEVLSNTEWRIRYRYWANQKGNIYLFDHCLDFVKKNSLEEGDFLELYEDEAKNLYFMIQRKEKDATESFNSQEDVGESYLSMMLETTEEEDLSLRMLVEEFNDNDKANTLGSL
ncbi:B3 domain-containing transcription factor LEC2-like [Helianthus annuus]|uniref:B3 domain-containing transcription factor LEC2-like n=1 Tax=Helianthus annuus TaxID=4232 RepID=UPI000B906D64|nr:B3 domain-containing transcription factor LEC2-like [Helianthus annuus]